VLAILQVDAAGTEVVERMLEQGGLPVLADLRTRGHLIPLSSPASSLEGGTTHTLHSGQGIPAHGLYFPLQWSAPEQRIRPAEILEWPEAIWERLSRAGRRCFVLDPYHSRPPQTHNGLCISGWQYTNRVSNRSWSVPAQARRALARRFGGPRVVEETFGPATPKRLLALGERLVTSPARAAELATRTLDAERFDLVWITFPAVHLGGHQFWDLSQVPDDIEPSLRVRLGGMLERIYAAADEALGRIVAALPANADLMVVSPLGMRAETSRSDLLPDMLAAVLGGEGGRSASEDRLSRLRAGLPSGLRAAIARPLPDRVVAELMARLCLNNVDWSRTRAFALPSNHEGCIRFNLRGRERDGIVAGAETQELAAQIAAGLATFDDFEGGAAVADVYRPEERLGDGPRSHQLPDLIVEWSAQPASRLTGVRSPRYGEVRRTAGVGRAGGHSADAWALLVPGASSLRTPSTQPDITDVAATAWALLGSDGDGRAGEPLLKV
jgi:predicted AlkP superfamily phosphohydrolase/phosphomutase